MTPEGRVKAKVKAFLKKLDVSNWSIIPNAMGNTVGVSDICGILPKTGQWLAIEVKAEGKKKNVTANQQAFIDCINLNNGIAVVVDCEDDLNALEQLLKDKGIL